MKEINDFIIPLLKEAHDQRHSARKALGMETITRGFAPNDQTSQSNLPPSGEKKYNKQEPEGPMSAVNTSGLEEETGKSERDEQQTIGPQDYVKFMGGSVRVVNTTNIPISVSITEFTSDVEGTIAKAYIVHIQDSGPSK
jgi:hypothetical protein